MLKVINKRITGKIGNSHIIWFEESNSWVQFEEPAWYIYRKIYSGTGINKIQNSFSRKYGLSLSESNTIILEIKKELDKLSSTSKKESEILQNPNPIPPKEIHSIHSYRIKGKVITISYATRLFEFVIHPSLSHLKIEKTKKAYCYIDLFPTDTGQVLKISDKVWIEKDSNFLKRKLFIELTNLIYNKAENDWLAYIHGSAISNEKETIVLSTASGSGKSTLAALLCKNGLKFVSDDYVPIDARFCKAYPFPAALSVKDGAYPVLLPLYEEIRDSQVYHFKGTNKTVKYLAFPDNGNYYKPLPVKNFVFVVYDSTKPYSFRKVPTLDAIKRFNDEAWLSPTPANARKFLKWFPRVNCYELVYSDNERAINQIKSLFEIPPK